MEKIGRSRLIWEEILENPFIYRIRESGSRENAYLLVSGEEALAVDPRSAEMLRSIRMLCRGIGAAEEKLSLFLTAGCVDDRMAAILKQLPPHAAVYGSFVPCEDEGDGADDPQILQMQISDGNMIRLGGTILRCIKTEGCARGLMSLWVDKEGILFCGDAVGCDHLPQVRMWDSRVDTLGLQFETLRRLRAMPVRMLLPGHGEPAGLDDLSGPDEELLPGQADPPPSNRSAKGQGAPGREPSAACAAVLDEAVRQYCIRLLEVYQRVPAKGSIPAEKLEKENGSEAAGVLSFCKYLLYRRYLRYRETESGESIYERGSVLLTDWNMRQA